MGWIGDRYYVDFTAGGVRWRQRIHDPETAELVAGLELIERERASQARRALAADLRVDLRMEELDALVRDQVRHELEALGYHQRKGEWRVRRG